MAKTVLRPQVLRRDTEPRWLTGAKTEASVLWFLAPGLLAVLALALRLYQVDQEPLWLDEGYTLLFSGLSWDRLFTVGGAHEHPPLYYALVHLCMSVYPSYLMPRFLAATFGALSVAAIFALGNRVGGRVCGLTAAVLLAVSPMHLWFSQDGRGYELAGLVVILSYLFGLSTLDRARRAAWLAYGLCTALCLYSEYTTVFALLPQLMFLFRAKRRNLIRPLLLTWGSVALLYLPWLGTLAFDAASIAGNYWIPPPSISGVSNTMLQFLGVLTPCASTPCTGTLLQLPLLAEYGALLAGIVALSVAAVGLAAAYRRDFDISLLVLWLVVPFLVVLVLSIGQSLYLDRIFLDATFPLYLLLGLGLSRVNRTSRWVAGVGTLALAASSVANLGSVYAGGGNPDWKSAARDFHSAYRPGQAVMFNPGVLRTLVHAYLPVGFKLTRERALWSRSYVDVPGWQRYYPTAIRPSKRERSQVEAVLRNRQLAAVAKGQIQVWLITFDYPGLNDTRHWFVAHGFELILSQEYSGDTRIELWSRVDAKRLASPVVADAGFGNGWQRSGRVSRQRGVAFTRAPAELRRTFAVQPGVAYSVAVDYRGMPPAQALTSLTVYDASGALLGTFPRTQWYDWPVNGVWLSQPFGFVAPPGSARAVLSLRSVWGLNAWRHVAVYRGL